MSKRKPFTDAERAYIKDNWATHTISSIALHLGRNLNCVQRAARGWGCPDKRSVKMREAKAKAKTKPLPRHKEKAVSATPHSETGARYLCDNYGYLRDVVNRRRLFADSGTRRIWSEKTFCDIYGLTVVRI